MTNSSPQNNEYKDVIRNGVEFSGLLHRHLAGKSVAIVGSAPRLLEAQNGAFIDAHDVVIRFNNSNNQPYPESAGRKTDIRCILFNVNETHKEFFRQLSEPSHIITKRRNEYILTELGLSRMAVIDYGLGARAVRLCDEIIGDTNFASRAQKPPRSGLVLLANIIGHKVPCKSISVFGMEREVRKEGSLHFYNASGSMSQILKNYDKYHCPLELEMEILNALLESHKHYIECY